MASIVTGFICSFRVFAGDLEVNGCHTKPVNDSFPYNRRGQEEEEAEVEEEEDEVEEEEEEGVGGGGGGADKDAIVAGPMMVDSMAEATFVRLKSLGGGGGGAPADERAGEDEPESEMEPDSSSSSGGGGGAGSADGAGDCWKEAAPPSSSVGLTEMYDESMVEEVEGAFPLVRTEGVLVPAAAAGESVVNPDSVDPADDVISGDSLDGVVTGE